MNNLKVMRLIDGTTLLAEVIAHTGSFLVHNPIEYMVEGDTTMAKPFLPGAEDDAWLIPSAQIVAISKPTEFFAKFYGSALYKMFVQAAVHKLHLSGMEEFDDTTKNALESKKMEIYSKFGLMDEQEFLNSFESRVKH